MENTIKISREKLLAYASHEKETSDEIIKKFSEDFSKNPVHALTWSANVFTASASKEICLFIEKTCEDTEHEWEEVLCHIVKTLTEAAMRLALYPPVSTSVQSNLVEVAKGQAAAQFLDKLKWR